MKETEDTILKAVRERRSIRNFLQKNISDNILQNLMDALRWAPSAGNLQARKFYFVHNECLKKKIAQAALNQNFIAEAPLVIVGCTDSRITSKYGVRGVSLYTVQDVAASIMGMMLVAHENGLGSTWIGAFHEHQMAEILNLSSYLSPAAVVPVGFPSEIPKTPPRVRIKKAVEVIS